MSIRIAPVRPEDAAAVERFVAAIQEHERTDVPELRPGGEIAVDYARWVGEMALANDGVLLLAWDDGLAVGLVAAWTARDEDRLLRDEHRGYGYVADLYVTETHRRRGIGRQLLAAAEAAMRQRGCRWMRLVSKAGNAAALATYAADGYRPYEVMLWKRLD